MCKLKSAIILKDRVFIPDYDSHNDMLEELGIKDTKDNASKLFVRAELSPKRGDVFSDIETWDFNIDQDILPEWFVAECDKKRMIEAVKEWSKSRIYIGVDNLEISDGGTHYIKDCKNVTCINSTVTDYGNSTVKAYSNSTVKAYDNSTVTAWDNSTVEAWYNSTVTAYNNSTVKAYDNSTVEAWYNSTVMAYGNSTVKAYNNSTVKAYDNSTVEAYNNSTVIKTTYSLFNKDRLTLCENSTFKDCKTKTIYQSGDWKFVAVNGKDERSEEDSEVH